MRESKLIWESFLKSSTSTEEVNPHSSEAMQLARGIKVETEHLTTQQKQLIDQIPIEALAMALDISLDHLAEDENYYTKLLKAKL